MANGNIHAIHTAQQNRAEQHSIAQHRLVYARRVVLFSVLQDTNSYDAGEDGDIDGDGGGGGDDEGKEIITDI